MPQPPNVLVLRAAGTNCDVETETVFRRVGAEATTLHLNRLIERPDALKDYDIVVVPGGFSYGDDIGSGVVFARQLRTSLRRPIEMFLDRGGLLLGVCNGFQVLLKAGLLTAEHGHFEERPSATLTWNAGARYEDRWVRIFARGGRTPWFPRETRIECPVRHAEGRFVTRDQATWDRLLNNGQLVLFYADANWETALSFHANPNGSQGGVAGMCSKHGQVLGLMPHPECHTYHWHHPHWTRDNTGQLRDTAGLQLFANGVEAVATRTMS